MNERDDFQHLSPETCEALAQGWLSGNARAQAIIHVRACAECAERLRASQRMIEDLKARFLVRRTVGGGLELIARRGGPEGDSQHHADRGGILRRRWLAAGVPIAAAAVLALMFWGPFRTGAPGGPDFRLPLDRDVIAVRSSEPGLETLRSGVEAYNDKNLTLAVSLLSQESIPLGHDGLRRLYLGSALALSGRHREALETLDPVSAASLPEPWGSEVSMVRGISLARVGDVEAARVLFEALAETDGEIGRIAREWRETLLRNP